MKPELRKVKAANKHASRRSRKGYKVSAEYLFNYSQELRRTL